MPSPPEFSSLPRHVTSDFGRIAEYARGQAAQTMLEELEVIYDVHACRLIGHGSFSDVLLANSVLGDQHVAIKVMGTLQNEDHRRVRQEVQTLRKVSDHPHIVRLLDVCQCSCALPCVSKEGPYLCIVMEYVGEPTLTVHIKDISDSLEGGFEDEESCIPKFAVNVVSTVGSALAYMHSKGYIHRDVWPDNILTDTRGKSVLCDLGSAACCNEEFVKDKLNLPYMAPSVWKGFNHSPADDCWALGLVLSEILTGKMVIQRLDGVTNIPVHEDRDVMQQLKAEAVQKSRHLGQICELMLNDYLHINIQDVVESLSEVQLPLEVSCNCRLCQCDRVRKKMEASLNAGQSFGSHARSRECSPTRVAENPQVPPFHSPSSSTSPRPRVTTPSSLGKDSLRRSKACEQSQAALAENMPAKMNNPPLALWKEKTGVLNAPGPKSPRMVSPRTVLEPALQNDSPQSLAKYMQEQTSLFPRSTSKMLNTSSSTPALRTASPRMSGSLDVKSPRAPPAISNQDAISKSNVPPKVAQPPKVPKLVVSAAGNVSPVPLNSWSATFGSLRDQCSRKTMPPSLVSARGVASAAGLGSPRTLASRKPQLSSSDSPAFVASPVPLGRHQPPPKAAVPSPLGSGSPRDYCSRKTMPPLQSKPKVPTLSLGSPRDRLSSKTMPSMPSQGGESQRIVSPRSNPPISVSPVPLGSARDHPSRKTMPPIPLAARSVVSPVGLGNSQQKAMLVSSGNEPSNFGTYVETSPVSPRKLGSHANSVSPRDYVCRNTIPPSPMSPPIVMFSSPRDHLTHKTMSPSSNMDSPNFVAAMEANGLWSPRGNQQTSFVPMHSGGSPRGYPYRKTLPPSQGWDARSGVVLVETQAVVSPRSMPRTMAREKL